MKLLYLLAPLLMLAAPSTARAASFDCAKAATPDEKAVCADPQLSALDDLTGRIFAAAMKEPDPDDRKHLRSVALDFLSARRQCIDGRRCIAVSYLDALGYYMRFSTLDVTLPAWLTAPFLAAGEAAETGKLPPRVGECVTTSVKQVTARLEGADFNTGTAITFANGGMQVSYEREAKVIASRPGDKVVMCLASTPRFCPPGDDRGKLYLVTNPRTHGTWWLPDSEHSCGGA